MVLGVVEWVGEWVWCVVLGVCWWWVRVGERLLGLVWASVFVGWLGGSGCWWEWVDGCSCWVGGVVEGLLRSGDCDWVVLGVVGVGSIFWVARSG